MDMLQIGFADWNRRDFNAFVRAAEKYGRHALKEIASEIDGKTEEQACTCSVPCKRHGQKTPNAC